MLLKIALGVLAVVFLFMFVVANISCGGTAPYDPENIPGFYLEQSQILGLGDDGGYTFSILASFEENEENFIVELAKYPTFAFNEEIQALFLPLVSDPSFDLLDEAQRAQRLEKASRWRPAARHIPWLAWSPLTEAEDDVAPVHIYKRAERGELMYVGTDMISVASLSGGDVEIANLFFEIFNKYEEEP